MTSEQKRAKRLEYVTRAVAWTSLVTWLTAGAALMLTVKDLVTEQALNVPEWGVAAVVLALVVDWVGKRKAFPAMLEAQVEASASVDSGDDS